jgi:flagellar hook-length control protein FliK
VKHEPAAKVLHIQLQPDGLGTVTIRMSVKDQTLRLDLEVGRGETAHLIQRDRETLSALLRSAGYLIDGVDVRIADPAGANAQTGSGQANTPMQGGGQSGSSQAEGRSPGERSPDGRPQNERGNNAFGNGRNGDDEQAGHAARSGGIFI